MQSSDEKITHLPEENAWIEIEGRRLLVLQKIGTGSITTAYLATDPKTGEKFVIKDLAERRKLDNLSATVSQTQQGIRARIEALGDKYPDRIELPLSLLGVSRFGGAPAQPHHLFLSRFMEGPTLREELDEWEQKEKMPSAEEEGIADQRIAWAWRRIRNQITNLGILKKANLLHLDIKTTNLTRRGIFDVGFMRRIGGIHRLGTVETMAPEIMLGQAATPAPAVEAPAKDAATPAPAAATPAK